VDRTRVRLGRGEAVFDAARAALRRWQQFQLGWVELCWPDTPVQVGAGVAVLARAAGFWWLNACRIVYVVDEAGPARRFGYAYGTLPSHAGRGEERFLVEMDPADGSVWYDILAFSRPGGWLIRLGYPRVRQVQKRFGRDSAAAMQRAVAAIVTNAPPAGPPGAAADVQTRGERRCLMLDTIAGVGYHQPAHSFPVRIKRRGPHGTQSPCDLPHRPA
jgi:uncharacterized protein (UPF0548 family)